MQKKTRLEYIKQIIFYIALSIEIIILLIDKSNYTNPIEGRLFQITFLFCVICVCMTKYTFKEYFVIFLFGVLGLIVDQITQRNEILRFVMFFAASKNMNLRQVLKYVFYTIGIGIFCIILLSVTGIYGEVAMITDFGRGGIETRYCLGLGHPNALHCMIWSLMTLLLYLYDEKMKMYYYVLLILFNIGLFLLTTSRTGLIIGIFTIILYMLFHYNIRLREQKSVYWSGFFFLFLEVAFSLLAAIRGIQDHIVNVFDKMINGRMQDAYFRGNISTWSLFSTPENNAYFDMGYVRIFYWYGIIPAIVIILVLGLMLCFFYRKRDYLGFCMYLVFSIYTVIEAHGVSVYIVRNFAMLLLIHNWNEVFFAQDGKTEYFWSCYKLLKKEA